MIPRLTNIDRAYAEIDANGITAVRIRPQGEKGQLGSRVGVKTEEVKSYIAEVLRDFNGEVIIELWKNGSNEDHIKYVVMAGGGGNSNMNGAGALAGVHPIIYQLMQQNNDTKIELMKLQLERQYESREPDYAKEGVGLFRDFLSRMNGGKPDALPAPAATPAPAQPVAGSGEASEQEGDVLDAFLDVEPDAEDLIEKLIRLKKEKPEMYAIARKQLEQL